MFVVVKSRLGLLTDSLQTHFVFIGISAKISSPSSLPMVTSGLLHGKCTLNKQLLDCNQEMKNTKVEMCHVLWSF